MEINYKVVVHQDMYHVLMFKQGPRPSDQIVDMIGLIRDRGYTLEILKMGRF